MRARVFAAAKYVLYPAFYLFCLMSCLYLTFPWDKLRDRIEAEFAQSQAKKGDRAWRLEIESLSGYWLTGIELQGAKIIMPPDEEGDDDAKAGAKPKGALSKVTSTAKSKKAAEDDAGDTASGTDEDEDEAKTDKAKAPKELVVLIEDAHARVRMLPLLIGRVRLDFSATVFGGEIHGLIPFGGGDLSVEIDEINLAQIAPLKDIVSVPLKGVATGSLALSAEDGKWSKASGSFSLLVKDMSIGDGKSKFRKLGMTMTPAQVGTFEISAKAEQGVFKFEKFGATGNEVELAGEGSLKLREPWDSSVLDLWLRFGFSEAYKNKDDRTKALFVDDGPFPALISQDRKLKRALRPDGLWGFNIKGKLARLQYIPTKADSPKSAKTTAASSDDDDDDTGATASTPTKTKKKTTTTKKKDDDDDSGSGDLPAPTSMGASQGFKRPPGAFKPPVRNSQPARDAAGQPDEGPADAPPEPDAPPAAPEGAEPEAAEPEAPPPEEQPPQ